jgi:hypothetical protein
VGQADPPRCHWVLERLDRVLWATVGGRNVHFITPLRQSLPEEEILWIWITASSRIHRTTTQWTNQCLGIPRFREHCYAKITGNKGRYALFALFARIAQGHFWAESASEKLVNDDVAAPHTTPTGLRASGIFTAFARIAIQNARIKIHSNRT